MMTPGAERREHPRLPTQLLVLHAADGQPVLDYATDLSRGGMFIKTDSPAPKGATLQVQFAPWRDARLVVAFCQVARVTPDGMGAQFVNLDDEARATLHAALA